MGREATSEAPFNALVAVDAASALAATLFSHSSSLIFTQAATLFALMGQVFFNFGIVIMTFNLSFFTFFAFIAVFMAFMVAAALAMRSFRPFSFELFLASSTNAAGSSCSKSCVAVAASHHIRQACLAIAMLLSEYRR